MEAVAKSKKEILVWVALLLLLRGIFIGSLATVFFFGEELEKGAAAKAMLDGIDVAHHKLSYHYYEGGGFAISHLKAVLFAIFGETLLAQRLGGLLTCALVFLAFWRLLDHHIGRRAARVGALLFLLGPESFQRYSQLSLGIHFEAMALGLFVLDEALRLVRQEDEPSRAQMARLGLASGFGIFFNLQILLVVGWAGLTVLLFRRSALFGRAGLVSVGGLLLGALPLIITAALVGRAVIDVHGTDPTEVQTDFSRVWAFFEPLLTGDGAWIHWSYLLLPLAASGVALSGEHRRTATYLLGYTALWLAAWATGPFLRQVVVSWFDWLRWAPAALALMLVGAIAFETGWKRGGAFRGAVLAGLLVFVVPGVRGFIAVVNTGQISEFGSNVGWLARTKGYDYRGYFPMLMRHLDSQSAEDIAPLLTFEEEDRDLLLTDLVISWLEGRRHEIEFGEQMDMVTRLDPDHRAALLRGLGASLVVHCKGDRRVALQQLEGFPREDGEALAEGLGYFSGYRYETLELLTEEAEGYGRGPLGPAYLRGAGARVYRWMVMTTYTPELCVDPFGAREFLETQAEDQVPHLLEGFDAEQARWTVGRDH